MCVGCRVEWEHSAPPEFAVREFDVFEGLARLGAWLVRLARAGLAWGISPSRARVVR